MSKFKKILAAISSLAIALSLTACADTSWASKINGTEISAGVYIFYLINGQKDASTKVSDSSKDVFSQKIGDVDATTYIKDYATNECKRLVAISDKFNQLGLALTDTDKKAIANTVNNIWDQNEKYYTNNGISKKSVSTIVDASTKETKIFEKLYEANGLEPVPQADIDAKFNSEYARIKMIPLPLTDKEGNALSTEDKAKLLDKADAYSERLKKGEKFNDIYDEYLKSVSSSTDTSGTADDPYKNEMIVYSGYQYLDANTVSEALKMKTNDILVLKSTSYYFLIQKLNLLERDDLKKNYRTTILHDIKDTDFEKILSDIYSKYTIEKNEDAYNRYDPKKVVNKK